MRRNRNKDEWVNRIKLLEETIKEAIHELEKTKQSFKSKKIKEVRKNLQGAINSCVS